MNAGVVVDQGFCQHKYVCDTKARSSRMNADQVADGALNAFRFPKGVFEAEVLYYCYCAEDEITDYDRYVCNKNGEILAALDLESAWERIASEANRRIVRVQSWDYAAHVPTDIQAMMSALCFSDDVPDGKSLLDFLNDCQDIWATLHGGPADYPDNLRLLAFHLFDCVDFGDVIDSEFGGRARVFSQILEIILSLAARTKIV